jgi:Holliday junction resolvasome RuvABC DNA-binding subunit
MELILRDKSTEVSIRKGIDEITALGFIEEFMIPAMNGLGYTPETIQDAIDEASSSCCCEDETRCILCGNPMDLCECDDSK